jgi:hypothetical protein
VEGRISALKKKPSSTVSPKHKQKNFSNLEILFYIPPKKKKKTFYNIEPEFS